MINSGEVRVAIKTTITHAATHLERLCEMAASGETVIIRREDGEDVALVSRSKLSSLLENMHLIRSPANAVRLFTALQRIEQERPVAYGSRSHSDARAGFVRVCSSFPRP